MGYFERKAKPEQPGGLRSGYYWLDNFIAIISETTAPQQQNNQHHKIALLSKVISKLEHKIY